MAVDICPSITAADPKTFGEQIARVANFALRLHVDVADGLLAPRKLIDLDQVWWPGGVRADLHVMYRRPFEFVDVYKALGPQMVIVHAEAEGDFVSFAQELHRRGIEVGVALLPDTPAQVLEPAIDQIDHVLIFSGKLGHYGGEADMKLLDKVAILRTMKPQLEIGWDGGVNDQNAVQLIAGGVDVLNVGGFIQQAESPEKAYATLITVARPQS